MKKILIVEDSEIKFANIRKVLNDNQFEYGNEPSKTYFDCWKNITRYRNEYKLIILDMAIPRFEQENPYMIAGYDILKRMNYECINIPTVILTGYSTFTIDGKVVSLEDLIDDITNDDDIISYVEILRYDNTSKDWETQLINFINKVEKGDVS